MIFLIIGLVGLFMSVLLLILVNIWLNQKIRRLRARIWHEYR